MKTETTETGYTLDRDEVNIRDVVKSFNAKGLRKLRKEITKELKYIKAAKESRQHMIWVLANRKESRENIHARRSRGWTAQGILDTAENPHDISAHMKDRMVCWEDISLLRKVVEGEISFDDIPETFTLDEINRWEY